MNGLLILAGGKATRLKNKPFVKFNGVPMLQIIYNELSEIFDEVVVSTRRRENENEIKKIKKLTDNSKIIYDNEEFNSINSPLVGIVSSFSEIKSEIVFVVSCDVPLIKKEIVEIILSKIKGFDAALPSYTRQSFETNVSSGVPMKEDKFIEPLIAAYNRKAMLAAGKTALNLNKLSVRDALKELNVNYIPMQKFKKIDPMLLSFKNVNSKEDLDYLMELERK